MRASWFRAALVAAVKNVNCAPGFDLFVVEFALVVVGVCCVFVICCGGVIPTGDVFSRGFSFCGQRLFIDIYSTFDHRFDHVVSTIIWYPRCQLPA